MRVGIGDRPDVAAEIEIVGIVRGFQDHDVRQPEAEIFFPLWERSVQQGAFYVRARGSSEAAARSIRAAVSEPTPALTILSMRTSTISSTGRS